jgi:hypothetical protein
MEVEKGFESFRGIAVGCNRRVSALIARAIQERQRWLMLGRRASQQGVQAKQLSLSRAQRRLCSSAVRNSRRSRFGGDSVAQWHTNSPLSKLHQQLP